MLKGEQLLESFKTLLQSKNKDGVQSILNEFSANTTELLLNKQYILDRLNPATYDVVKWYWTGDKAWGAGQDTWIPYTYYLMDKLETEYQKLVNGAEISSVTIDKERFVDFTQFKAWGTFRQCRYDDMNKRRAVKRCTEKLTLEHLEKNLEELERTGVREPDVKVLKKWIANIPLASTGEKRPGTELEQPKNKKPKTCSEIQVDIGVNDTVYKVYKEGDNCWSCVLTKLLERITQSSYDPNYVVYVRQGRIGEPGEAQIIAPKDNADSFSFTSTTPTSAMAKSEFNDRLKGISGLDFETLLSSVATPQGPELTFKKIELNHGNKVKTNLMPLGPLLSSTINKANKVLEEIFGVVRQGDISSSEQSIIKLSDRFYNLVPTSTTKLTKLDNLSMLYQKYTVLVELSKLTESQAVEIPDELCKLVFPTITQ